MAVAESGIGGHLALLISQTYSSILLKSKFTSIAFGRIGLPSASGSVVREAQRSPSSVGRQTPANPAPSSVSEASVKSREDHYHFTGRFGICCIVLLLLHIRLHPLCGHEAHLVPVRGEFACPVVRGRACLDAHSLPRRCLSPNESGLPEPRRVRRHFRGRRIAAAAFQVRAHSISQAATPHGSAISGCVIANDARVAAGRLVQKPLWFSPLERLSLLWTLASFGSQALDVHPKSECGGLMLI